MFITTAYYEKLTEQEQNKVGSIIDSWLTDGMLEIKELWDLHSAIDNLIINEDLNWYTEDGYKRRIQNIRLEDDGWHCEYDPLDTLINVDGTFYNIGDKMLDFEAAAELTLDEYAALLEKELLLDPSEIQDAVFEYKQFNKED